MSDASLLSWWYGATLWTLAVFAVVVLCDVGLRRTLGPRARMILYALVLVRLCLPLDFTSPLGVAASSTARPLATTPAPPAALPATTSTIEAAAVEVPWLSRGASTIPAAVSLAVVRVPWPAVVWLAGVLGLAAIAVARRRAASRIVAEAEPAEARLQAAGGRARVLVHPEQGPVAHGLRDPVIVLPQSLVQRLDADALRCIVDHERAHHEGGDPWLAAALTVVAIVAWPIAAVWLASRRVRTLIEQAADERALHRGDAAARRRYGHVLLGLAAGPRPPRLAPGLSAYRDLRARIVAIVRPTRTPRWLQATQVGVIGAAIVACAAVPDDDLDAPVREADCPALKRSATVLHDDVEKGRARAEDAAAAYDAFFETCPADPDVSDLTYYAGELYWSRAARRHDAGDRPGAARDFARARQLFDRAIDEGSSFSQDAAWGQHLAVRNATGWSEDAELPTVEDFAFISYSAADRAVLDSWQRYVDVVGRPLPAAQAPEQLRIAKLAMQHNDFDTARPNLEELVQHHPETTEALRAAEMLVDVLTIAWTEKDVDAATEAARAAELVRRIDAIEASPIWAHPEAARLRNAGDVLRAGVRWKRAERDLAAAEAGEDPSGYTRCADTFEALIAEYPEHSRLDVMRDNATKCRARAR